MTTTTATTTRPTIALDARVEERRTRWTTIAVASIVVASLPIVLLHGARGLQAMRADGDARSSTSYAVGVSAGAGLRGVVDVPLDAFRSGLVDGLAGAPRHASVMSRAEQLARLREAMRRLSEAEIAAVASRIDESGDH